MHAATYRKLLEYLVGVVLIEALCGGVTLSGSEESKDSIYLAPKC